MIKESLKRRGSSVRWVPHDQMPVDALVKQDVAKASRVLSVVLNTGKFQVGLGSGHCVEEVFGFSAEEKRPCGYWQGDRGFPSVRLLRARLALGLASLFLELRVCIVIFLSGAQCASGTLVILV